MRNTKPAPRLINGTLHIERYTVNGKVFRSAKAAKREAKSLTHLHGRLFNVAAIDVEVKGRKA